MEEKITYRLDQSNGILFKYYRGDITIEDISSSWEHAIENQSIPKETKGFILDYTKATFKIKFNEYHLIADFYKNHLDVFSNQKIAIVIDNPSDIVIPILVESEDDGYTSRPFNTIDAAIAWVLS